MAWQRDEVQSGNPTISKHILATICRSIEGDPFVSEQAIREEILEPMQRLFLPPKQMEQAQQISAMRDYMDALRGFEREDLQQSWRTVRDTHTSRGWPLPAAFVAAAVKAKKDRTKPGQTRSRLPWESPSKEECWENWKKIRQSATAKLAAREGWSWSLRCGVLDGSIEGAEQIDVAKFQSDHRRVHANAERLQADWEMVYPTEGRIVRFTEANREIALKLWNGILVHEAQTQQEINYGVEREAAE